MQLTDGVLALLNVLVGGFIILRSRRWLGRLSLPWIALGMFFVLRAVARLYDAIYAGDPDRDAQALGLLVDGLLAVALIVVLFTSDNIIRSVTAQVDAARYRAQEYERARRHYEQVVRHRLFNPLTVIKGAAVTLRDEPRLDPISREQLLDSIIDASDTLETVSLVPERRDELERELDAIPRLPDGDRRRTRFPDGPPGPS